MTQQNLDFANMTREQLAAVDTSFNSLSLKFALSEPQYQEFISALIAAEPPSKCKPQIVGTSRSGHKIMQTGYQQYTNCTTGEITACLSHAFDA